MTDPDHIGTFVSERVDGFGRTVEKISRHREGANADEIVERKVTIKYNALGLPTVSTREQGNMKVSRLAKYDTLGRLRINRDLNFGTWQYEYDEIGQLIRTLNPLGQATEQFYDRAGRLTSTYVEGQLHSEYFYDVFPEGKLPELEEEETSSAWNGYPAYAITLGRLVAVRDRAGITVGASDRGLYSETWRQVFPDRRVYRFASQVDAAGQLIYSEDPEGKKSTVEYYKDGAFKSNYWDGRQIIKKSRSNMFGQGELVEYGDAAQTVVWSGYDPVTHRAQNTVVQQLNHTWTDGDGNTQTGKATLLSFGYQYDEMGKLTGIADWRGRGSGSSSVAPGALHPTQHTTNRTGCHQAAFPGNMDGEMTAPRQWNDTDVISPETGWPVGATPSDAVFEYDTLYQLVGEDRVYATGTGDDFYLEGTGQKRVRSLSWTFDDLGSMASWTDEPPDASDEPAVKNLGRALGSKIVNGYQLNLTNGCNMDILGSESDGQAATGPEVQSECKHPEAVYFATNTEEMGDGKGTCIWADYDGAGRMVSQVVKTGCTSCAEVGAPSGGPDGAVCNGSNDGTVPANTTEYAYVWNALGQLSGANKIVNGTEHLTMSYIYDASGGRVIREKSDIIGGELNNIRQDVYVAGGYERRQVQLQDLGGNPVPIRSPEAVAGFVDIEGTRLVKYASGVRIQQEWEPGLGTIEAAEEELFISFSNHLGSTSAVVDYQTGKLVEWRTNYAYGADESHWKNTYTLDGNGDPKYDNAEEPYGFTGKEEDKEIGLHYFGARYYSAYLGRWLSPDPVTTHAGAVANTYGYGGNSPYIYVDPDGRWIHIVVGAIVGAVAGAVTGALSGGLKGALIGAAIGAAAGAVIAATAGAASGLVAGGWAGAAAVTGGASVAEAAIAAGATATAGLVIGATAVGAVAGGLVSAGIAYGQARMSGASKTDAWISAGISFGASAASFGLGAAAGQIGGTASSAAGKFFSSLGKSIAVGAITSASTTALQVGISTDWDFSEADWDDVAKDYAIGLGISAASSALGAGMSDLLGKAGGGHGRDVGAPISGKPKGLGYPDPLPTKSSSLPSNHAPEKVEGSVGNTIIFVGEPTPGHSGHNIMKAAQNYQDQHGGVIVNVKSGAEMIDVMNYYGEKGGIDRLAYFGHGGPSIAAADMNTDTMLSLYTNEAFELLSTGSEAPGVLARKISDINPGWFNNNATIELRGCYMGDKMAPALVEHIGRGVTVWGSKGQMGAKYIGGGVYDQVSVDKYQYKAYR